MGKNIGQIEILGQSLTLYISRDRDWLYLVDDNGRTVSEGTDIGVVKKDARQIILERSTDNREFESALRVWYTGNGIRHEIVKVSLPVREDEATLIRSGIYVNSFKEILSLPVWSETHKALFVRDSPEVRMVINELNARVIRAHKASIDWLINGGKHG